MQYYKEFAAKPSEARSSAKSGTKNLKSSNPKGPLLRQRRTGAGGRRFGGNFARPTNFGRNLFEFFRTHTASIARMLELSSAGTFLDAAVRP